MDEVSAVETALDAIESLDIPYMVVGSLSSNAYGIVRTTQDVDILVDIAASDIAGLREAIEPPLAWHLARMKHVPILEEPFSEAERALILSWPGTSSDSQPCLSGT